MFCGPAALAVVPILGNCSLTAYVSLLYCDRRIMYSCILLPRFTVATSGWVAMAVKAPNDMWYGQMTGRTLTASLQMVASCRTQPSRP